MPRQLVHANNTTATRLHVHVSCCESNSQQPRLGLLDHNRTSLRTNYFSGNRLQLDWEAANELGFWAHKGFLFEKKCRHPLTLS